jgi:hypothetical protein
MPLPRTAVERYIEIAAPIRDWLENALQAAVEQKDPRLARDLGELHLAFAKVTMELTIIVAAPLHA